MIIVDSIALHLMIGFCIAWLSLWVWDLDGASFLHVPFKLFFFPFTTLVSGVRPTGEPIGMMLLGEMAFGHRHYVSLYFLGLVLFWPIKVFAHMLWVPLVLFLFTVSGVGMFLWYLGEEVYEQVRQRLQLRNARKFALIEAEKEVDDFLREHCL